MRAMVMPRLGPPSLLELREEPDPEPGPGELAIEVEASGCNWADALLCRGKYQLRREPPFAPGIEVAGRVCAVGEGAGDWRPGPRVFVHLHSGGGFATRVVAPASDAHGVPEGVPAAEAVALGIAYQTAYLGLVTRAGLRAGEWLLVHAAAGGVGLAAVEVGRALGARVIATAGSEEKLPLCRERGAELALCTADPDWGERVRAHTGGRGADVILDSVGGAVLEASLRCVAWGARVLVIGFSSGEIPLVKLNRVLLKHIALIGLNLNGYAEHEPEAVESAVAALFALHERGAVRPLIGGRYPLAEAAAALEALESRRSVGKLVLVPEEGASPSD